MLALRGHRPTTGRAARVSANAAPCPRCGGMLLVYAEVPFVVTALGGRDFHVAAPFGSTSVVHDAARAECNQRGCLWNGRLREAVAWQRRHEGHDLEDLPEGRCCITCAEFLTVTPEIRPEEE